MKLTGRRYFKPTHRVGVDLITRAGCKIDDLYIKAEIEDLCIAANEASDILPPIETGYDGADSKPAGFVRMDATKANGMSDTMYLVLVEDTEDPQSYAVVAAWTSDFYESKKSRTGIGGGLLSRPLGTSTGYENPKVSFKPSSSSIEVPSKSFVSSLPNPHKEELAEVKMQMSSYALALKKNYQITVMVDGVLKVSRFCQEKEEIGEITEGLMQDGWSKDDIYITKSLRPKIRVVVDFDD